MIILIFFIILAVFIGIGIAIYFIFFRKKKNDSILTLIPSPIIPDIPLVPGSTFSLLPAVNFSGDSKGLVYGAWVNTTNSAGQNITTNLAYISPKVSSTSCEGFIWNFDDNKLSITEDSTTTYLTSQSATVTSNKIPALLMTTNSDNAVIWDFQFITGSNGGRYGIFNVKGTTNYLSTVNFSSGSFLEIIPFTGTNINTIPDEFKWVLNTVNNTSCSECPNLNGYITIRNGDEFIFNINSSSCSQCSVSNCAILQSNDTDISCIGYKWLVDLTKANNNQPTTITSVSSGNQLLSNIGGNCEGVSPSVKVSKNITNDMWYFHSVGTDNNQITKDGTFLICDSVNPSSGKCLQAGPGDSTIHLGPGDPSDTSFQWKIDSLVCPSTGFCGAP